MPYLQVAKPNRMPRPTDPRPMSVIDCVARSGKLPQHGVDRVTTAAWRRIGFISNYRLVFPDIGSSSSDVVPRVYQRQIQEEAGVWVGYAVTPNGSRLGAVDWYESMERGGAWMGTEALPKKSDVMAAQGVASSPAAPCAAQARVMRMTLYCDPGNEACRALRERFDGDEPEAGGQGGEEETEESIPRRAKRPERAQQQQLTGPRRKRVARHRAEPEETEKRDESCPSDDRDKREQAEAQALLARLCPEPEQGGEEGTEATGGAAELPSFAVQEANAVRQYEALLDAMTWIRSVRAAHGGTARSERRIRPVQEAVDALREQEYRAECEEREDRMANENDALLASLERRAVAEGER